MIDFSMAFLCAAYLQLSKPGQNDSPAMCRILRSVAAHECRKMARIASPSATILE